MICLTGSGFDFTLVLLLAHPLVSDLHFVLVFVLILLIYQQLLPSALRLLFIIETEWSALLGCPLVGLSPMKQKIVVHQLRKKTYCNQVLKRLMLLIVATLNDRERVSYKEKNSWTIFVHDLNQNKKSNEEKTPDDNWTNVTPHEIEMIFWRSIPFIHVSCVLEI